LGGGTGGARRKKKRGKGGNWKKHEPGLKGNFKMGVPGHRLKKRKKRSNTRTGADQKLKGGLMVRQRMGGGDTGVEVVSRPVVRGGGFLPKQGGRW